MRNKNPISIYLLMILINPFFLTKSLLSLESNIDNSIILLNKGPGNGIQKISNDYTKGPLPDEIYINDFLYSKEISRNIDLNGEENIIKLKWKNKLSNTTYMFQNCRSIISADLTKFDTSSITDTYNQFTNCTSLKFVNLTNVKYEQSKMTILYGFFDGCSSLTSIDLSTLYAPNLDSYRYMFKDCISLVSLDLSTKLNSNKLHRVNNAFNGAKNLVLLDLSNLNTSGILNSYSGNVFDNCDKLKYINLRNYVFTKGKDIDKFETIQNNDLIIFMNKFEEKDSSF